MKEYPLENDICKENFDIDGFVEMAINDQDSRNYILNLMLHHEHIMVYYHSFYIISKASVKRPDLFYPYWDKITPLLNHKNSYHRDFALTILANLTQADEENRFSRIFSEYFDHLNDEKFMTSECCIRNAAIIITHRPQMLTPIMALLFDIDRISAYPDKQKALMKWYILEIIEKNYKSLDDTSIARHFILAQKDCVSPKTRKKARKLMKDFGIS